jgi:hypothetical protein
VIRLDRALESWAERPAVAAVLKKKRGRWDLGWAGQHRRPDWLLRRRGKD